MIRLPFSDQLASLLLQQRVRCLVALFACFVMIIILRLTLLQCIQYQHFHRLAQQNYTNPIWVSAKRGLIFDRHGTLLAGNRAQHALRFKKKPTLATWHTMQTQYPALLNRPYPKYGHLNHLQDKTLAQLMTRPHPDWYIETHLSRIYPFGDITTTPIGYVAWQTPTLHGLTGIEQAYDKTLRGKLGLNNQTHTATHHTLATDQVRHMLAKTFNLHSILPYNVLPKKQWARQGRRPCHVCKHR